MKLKNRPSIAWAVGIAPQFNTGPVRWTLFTVINASFAFDTDGKVLDLSQNGKVIQTQSVKETAGGDYDFGAMGLGVEYRPWNLSLVFALSSAESGSFYTLRWKKAWGGSDYT